MLNAGMQLAIGAENGDAHSRKLNGYLDELRICGVARSAAWIQLCYGNQKADQTLVGYDNPRITVQPKDVEVHQAAPCTLRVAAIGMPAPSYQWFKGFDEEIAGATQAQLVIPSAAISDETSYYCRVSNDHGVVTSEVAHVTVVPYDQTVNNPLPDLDNDGYPAVVETLFGTSDSDPASAPQDVAKVDTWKNNPDIRKRVVYDFSGIEGYSTRSAIPVDIYPGTVASEYVPVIQALDAAPPGVPDPDLSLPEGATTFGKKVFAVTCELVAGKQISIQIPYPDSGWHPRQCIIARRYNPGSGQWEQIGISATTGGAMRVPLTGLSDAYLTFAEDKGKIHFVGSWTGAYAPPLSNYAGATMSEALARVTQLNTDADPNNDVAEVWVTRHPGAASGVAYTPTLPTTNDPREVTLALPSSVRLLGGFPIGGGDWYTRDPQANETVLSGNIGHSHVYTDNCYHVV